MLSANM